MGWLTGLSLKTWGFVGIALLVVGLGLAVKVQTSRLATSKAETIALQGRFDAFVVQAKALGEAQNEKAKAQDLANQQLKEKTDAQLSKSKSDLAGVYAAYRGLRDSRESSHSGTVSSLPVSTVHPDRICFDRAKFAGAVGIIEAGVPGIAQQGDIARLRLKLSKEWANSLKLR